MGETEPTRSVAATPTQRSPWARPEIVVAALAWLTFALLAAYRWHGRAMDDFFITFRYAQNLAAGHGLVFNPGERVFGTTAPGYALLLGALSAISRVPPHWLGAATTVFTLPLVALLVALDTPRGRRPEAIAGGCLLVGCSYLWLHHGSELPVVLCLLVSSGVVCDRRPGLAGIFAGAAVWCRPDAVLGAAGLGLLSWWRQRRLPWRYATVVAVLTLLGLLVAWWWFGRPLPATLEVKRIQATWMPAVWPSGAAFWPSGFRSLQVYYGGPLTAALIATGLIGQVALFRHAGRGLQTLAVYGLGVACAYPFLGVPFYTWYALPGLATVLYGVAFGLGSAARASRRLGSRVGRVAAGLSVLLAGSAILLDPVKRTIDLAAHSPAAPRHRLYRAAGEWLAGHTAPGERFAAVEVGTLAYFARRPATDLMGLVSPEVLPRLRRGDFLGAFLRHPTRVVVDSSFGAFGMMQKPFARRYTVSADFRGRRHWIRVYTLAPGARLPRPRGGALRRAEAPDSSTRTGAPRPVLQRDARLSPRSDSSSVPREPTSRPGSPGGSSS